MPPRRTAESPLPVAKGTSDTTDPMPILWRYLEPYRGSAALSLLLAGIAQVLALVDPILFGMIVDTVQQPVPIAGADDRHATALQLLALAVVVAIGSRLAKAVQEYVTRRIVQGFGTRIFNDGLRQSLRLTYETWEARGSGETLSTLLKVRTDTERFINAFINILFSSLVGVGFLTWYSVTKHWALVPVFLFGVLLLGGLTGLVQLPVTLRTGIGRIDDRMCKKVRLIWHAV